jgi:hypothetical protein
MQRCFRTTQLTLLTSALSSPSLFSFSLLPLFYYNPLSSKLFLLFPYPHNTFLDCLLPIFHLHSRSHIYIHILKLSILHHVRPRGAS